MTNSVPIYFNKIINNSKEYSDNYTDDISLGNIINKKNKKINKINIIKVNSKNKILNTNKKVSNLKYYTNFVKDLNSRKSINNNNNNHKTKSTSISNSFKYKKKIISYNSFNKKKDKNDSFNLTLQKKENIMNQYSFINKSQENSNNSDIKNMKKLDKIYREIKGLALNKIDIVNHKKKFNLNKLNNLNNKIIINNNSEFSYHTTKHMNINKKLKNDLNQKNANKGNETKYTIDKTIANSSGPLIKTSFSKYNAIISKNKNILKMNVINKSNTLNNDSHEKYINNSLNKINNNSFNSNRFTLKIEHCLNESNDKYNINQNNKNYSFGYEKKRINTFNNKINNKPKMSIFISTNNQKEIVNLKKNFLNHFSSKNSNKTKTINDISFQETQNKKNKINYNFKIKKKKESNENSIINSSLSELINKFRQTK